VSKSEQFVGVETMLRRVGFLFAVVGFALYFLSEFIVIPMSQNYAECKSVFLCHGGRQ